jgi:hypothetical protein
MQATIVTDEIRTVTAVADDDRLLIDPDALVDALGWEWKPEGLCRGDVCVPVRDHAAVMVGEQLDVGAVAAALGRLVVVDAPAGIAAIASSKESRHEALQEHRAPAFMLPDLDGVGHRLEEWRGKKKLLVAFATW